MRGVVSVVTGGGKTVFAFLCMREFRRRYPDGTVIVLVPTMTLLDQWSVGLQHEFAVPADEIACFSSQEKTRRPCPVNVLVINTARRKVSELPLDSETFLIVDECHRAGSPENAKALQGRYAATLGLSATPHREYDDGFQQHVVPTLGPVIFEYTYTNARSDGVVTPFDLINVQVTMLPHEQKEYDRFTKRVSILLRRLRVGQDLSLQEQLKRVLQRRAAVSANAIMRLPVAARLVENNRGARTIVFHERVSAAESLFETLLQRHHSVCLYHSRIGPDIRRDNLRLFRRGVFDVLISCRALDEGMNVPETTVAIIASSTASSRQRIQRLGRVLRPVENKDRALIYTLYATDQERARLDKEAGDLEGVARVEWATATRQPNGVA
jgi:superfamily II DNA or RNA helicase